MGDGIEQRKVVFTNLTLVSAVTDGHITHRQVVTRIWKDIVEDTKLLVERAVVHDLYRLAELLCGLQQGSKSTAGRLFHVILILKLKTI